MVPHRWGWFEYAFPGDPAIWGPPLVDPEGFGKVCRGPPGSVRESLVLIDLLRQPNVAARRDLQGPIFCVRPKVCAPGEGSVGGGPPGKKLWSNNFAMHWSGRHHNSKFSAFTWTPWG